MFELDPYWLSCLGAFWEEDYEKYVQFTQPKLLEKPDDMFIWLFVISLQRLNRTDLLEGFIPRLLEWDNPRAAPIMGLILGRTELKTILKNSTPPDLKILYQFYAASRHFTVGEIKKAKNLFRKCLQVSVDEGTFCLEIVCAHGICQKRGWPTPVLPHQ